MKKRKDDDITHSKGITHMTIIPREKKEKAKGRGEGGDTLKLELEEGAWFGFERFNERLRALLMDLIL